MTTELRRALVDDAPEIARINVAASLVAYEGILSPDFLATVSPGARERTWRARLASDPSRTVLIAERDGSIVGYCGLATPGLDADAAADVAEVSAIYVEPSLWRSGIGTILMGTSLAWLREREWAVVTLWVFEDNLRARGFYARFGFVADGARQTHATLGAPELRLRLEL